MDKLIVYSLCKIVYVFDFNGAANLCEYRFKKKTDWAMVATCNDG